MALLVASIDFGTTYSGWAYSSRTEYDGEPTKVYARQWQGGSLMSTKGEIPSNCFDIIDGDDQYSMTVKTSS